MSPPAHRTTLVVAKPRAHEPRNPPGAALLSLNQSAGTAATRAFPAAAAAKPSAIGTIAIAVAWLLMPGLESRAEAQGVSRQRRVVPAIAAATLRVPPGVRLATLARPIPVGRRVHVGWRATVPGETLDAVRLALLEAARVTGLRGEVLQRIAERESRLDPMARSGSSSATGLMQFTRDTWLEVVRDFGERHGLVNEAAALQTDRDGRITAQDPQALHRILSLRENARYSAILAAERLRAARPGLETTLGRAATPADLYLIHLLGPTGSRRFLAALRDNPQQTSVALLGDRAVTNPAIFQHNGQSLSLVHVYAALGRMFEGPIEVAELRRTQPD